MALRVQSIIYRVLRILLYKTFKYLGIHLESEQLKRLKLSLLTALYQYPPSAIMVQAAAEIASAFAVLRAEAVLAWEVP